MKTNLPATYGQILDSLKAKIKQAQLKAAVTANVQLLAVYWEIGHVIAEQEKLQGWGLRW